MKMSCIAIQIDQHEPIFIALEKLGYLHIVGVVGGNVMVMAGSPEVDGTITSYKWPELSINNSSQVSVYLDACVEGTAPLASERQTIKELEERFREGMEKLKYYEERAVQIMETVEKPAVTRPESSSIRMFREAEPVFDASGEHVQFEINWKTDQEPKISVSARENYDDDSPKNHYVSMFNGPDKYVFRFGS